MSKLIHLVLLAGFLIGCSKEPSTPSASPMPTPTPMPVEANSTEDPAPPPGAVAPTTTETPAPVETRTNSEPQEGVTIENFNTHVQGLQRAVDQYVQDQKKKPASLEEIMRAGYLEKLPPATKGKRYVLDAQTGQVKEVNQ